jgi:hypothetical protein
LKATASVSGSTSKVPSRNCRGFEIVMSES